MSGCTGWRDTTCSIALGEAEARAAFEAGEKDKPDPLPDIMYMPELYPNNLEAEVFDGTGASSEVVQSRSIGPLGYFSKDTGDGAPIRSGWVSSRLPGLTRQLGLPGRQAARATQALHVGKGLRKAPPGPGAGTAPVLAAVRD